MNEIEAKIFETIKLIMGLDISGMDKKTKFNSMPQWDSFNNLMLISKFQEEFKIEFSAVEIEETQTIEALFNLIENKIAK